MNPATINSPRSIRCWKEHEQNQTFRFQSAKLDPNRSGPRARGVPATAGLVSPSGVKAGWGVSLPMNPEPVTGHKSAEICGAPLRRALRLGHAKNSQLTGQQDKEN